MKLAHPDIVVTGPDGDYLMIVEVNLNDNKVGRQNPIDQLKSLMASLGCSIGLAVLGEKMFLLRDSLEKSHGESIEVVGEAKLPESLLSLANKEQNKERTTGYEFESQVQQWLETLKLTSNLEHLPKDLRKLFAEPIISLLRVGEIRAAGPRWSRVAN